MCDIIFPGTVARYDQLPLQLGGFCPVALLSGGGFLLPGNTKLGTLRQGLPCNDIQWHHCYPL